MSSLPLNLKFEFDYAEKQGSGNNHCAGYALFAILRRGKHSFSSAVACYNKMQEHTPKGKVSNGFWVQSEAGDRSRMTVPSSIVTEIRANFSDQWEVTVFIDREVLLENLKNLMLSKVPEHLRLLEENEISIEQKANTFITEQAEEIQKLEVSVCNISEYNEVSYPCILKLVNNACHWIAISSNAYDPAVGSVPKEKLPSTSKAGSGLIIALKRPETFV